MTLADLIMDDKTAEETKDAVSRCIRATMMSAIDTFKMMVLADAPVEEVAEALAQCESLCVEETLARVHCTVIGKPRAIPSAN